MKLKPKPLTAKITAQLPINAHLKEFQGILKEDVAAVPKKKKRKLALAQDGGLLKVALKPGFREPAEITFGKARLVRNCTWGNAGAETLVRRNLEMMIRKVKEVGKRMLCEQDGEVLLDRCLDPVYGVDRTGFVDSKGKPLKADGRAVYEMIKQFFKDEEFVKKLVQEVRREFYGQKKP
jgi:hypothetical protein